MPVNSMTSQHAPLPPNPLSYNRSQVPAKPFLRWAGGKSRVVQHLLKYLPIEEPVTYWEPFLGAAALYFSLAPVDAHLSDSNPDLVACYMKVRDNPVLLYHYLRIHMRRTSEEYYYLIRAIYNKSKPSTAQAARFIYLNKTSFNGIFRVNTAGIYNVPYGHKEPPALPSLYQLRAVSKLLKTASLETQPYDEVLQNPTIAPGSLIYLDPPYPALTATSAFAHYTAARFSWADQERLSLLANQLSNRGCYVMLSNLDISRVRELYRHWFIHALPVTRWLAANGTRHSVNELVITNYPSHVLRGGS